MGKSESIRQLSIQHNSAISQRATLQQKLFVLDYIKQNQCSLSKAVQHFISTGCNFKISVSTLSDWKMKEDELRKHSLGQDIEGILSVPGQQNDLRNGSLLLSKRLKLQFRYPLIVEKLEHLVRELSRKNLAVNETVLISMWKQIARDHLQLYKLSDDVIEKGPSKGFMYRFKARNGIGSHKNKIREEINNEREELSKIYQMETLTEGLSIAEPDDHPQQQQRTQMQMINCTHVFDTSSGNLDVELAGEIDSSIMRISQYLERNRSHLKNSGKSFERFIRYYQQERQELLMPHIYRQSMVSRDIDMPMRNMGEESVLKM